MGAMELAKIVFRAFCQLVALNTEWTSKLQVDTLIEL